MEVVRSQTGQAIVNKNIGNQIKILTPYFSVQKNECLLGVRLLYILTAKEKVKYVGAGGCLFIIKFRVTAVFTIHNCKLVILNVEHFR